MKILHLSPAFFPALVYGGPMRALWDLCRALAEAGDTVRVLTTDANGSGRVDAPAGREIELPAHGGRALHVLYARRRWRHTVSPELVRALPARMRWADVAHVTAVYSFPTLPALLAARAAGTPVVVSPRGSFGRFGRQRRRAGKAGINAFLRALARRGVTFHATAETEAADIRAALGPVPVVVVPNGIDAGEFATLPCEAGSWLRHAASLKIDDGPLVGCLGRLHEKKGLDRLVRALPVLMRAWPRLHAVLAGPDDGVEQARLERLAATLGVGERLHFLGGLYGADRISFLAGLDVFVLPSLDENFGNAITESLAAGTPAVASRHCPWPELESERCGRWIESEVSAVAGAVQAVLAGDAVAMGERGRAFVMRERRISAAAERMRAVYRAASRTP